MPHTGNRTKVPPSTSTPPIDASSVGELRQIVLTDHHQPSSPMSFSNFCMLDSVIVGNYYDDLDDRGNPVTPPRPAKRAKSSNEKFEFQNNNQTTSIADYRTLHSGADQFGNDISPEAVRIGCLDIVEFVERARLRANQHQLAWLVELRSILVSHHPHWCRSNVDGGDGQTASPQQSIMAGSAHGQRDGRKLLLRNDGIAAKKTSPEESCAYNVASGFAPGVMSICSRRGPLASLLHAMAVGSGKLGNDVIRIFRSSADLEKLSQPGDNVGCIGKYLLALVTLMLVELSSEHPTTQKQLAAQYEVIQESVMTLCAARNVQQSQSMKVPRRQRT